MPLLRGEWTINGITIEAEPAEWPRHAWEVLEIRVTERTGWKTLPKSVVDSFNALFAGAHGSVEDGLKGKVVQYVEGTGPSPFTVSDWRGNSGSYIFLPDTGFEPQEIQGTAEDAPLTGGFYTATFRLLKV